MPTLQESLRALQILEAEKEKLSNVPEAKKLSRKKKYIQLVIENFRRSKKGNQLIEQELELLIEYQARMFPGKPMATPDKVSIRFMEGGVKNLWLNR